MRLNSLWLFVTEVVNPDNPGGRQHFGMGDMLIIPAAEMELLVPRAL
jgi:hypothetical protein